MNLRTRTRRGAPVAVAMLVGAFALASCGSDAGAKPNYDEALISQEACQRNADAGTITYVSGYGYSASAGQMDVFIADELGYFDDLCLDVDIQAAGGNGQQLVSSGQAHFTELGSAEDVLMAAANSDNLTAVATYGTSSPFCVFANDEINSLADLEGGTLGYFINLTPVAAAMFDAAGADISQTELVKMSNYDPTVVLRGQPDAVVGYASNQCATLESDGQEFSSFTPEEFELSGTYNVMEVNSRFLEEHSETASDFLRAELKALEYCLEDEEDCVERISSLAEENNQGDAFPPEKNARTWAMESEWVRDSEAGPPGVQSRESWENAADIVQTYGSVQDIPPVDEVADFDLVDDLYDDGELIWPGSE